ncbi:hypothetical protein ElyMa_004832600 [Elysia marginata]|uniref:Homeobox domain-containing protein n=1 Tax=Elysia marginata TaxID=1093978 RepID=A0AAV4IQ32_9GAST|nr:hypothetical protein ElyMa_004832600 [Elysia marginata]
MQKGYGPSPDSMGHHAAPAAYHHGYYPDIGVHGYSNHKYDHGMYGPVGGAGGAGGAGGLVAGGMAGGGYPHHHQGGNCSPLGGDASVLNSYYHHHHQNSCAVQGSAIMADPNCMVDAGGGGAGGGGLYDPNGYPAVCGVMQGGMGGLHPGSVMTSKQQHEIYPWMKESRQNNKQRQAQVTGKLSHKYTVRP